MAKVAATKPRAADRITVVDVDGEAVVYDPSGVQLHYLNRSAALVLDLCDGHSTIREMSEAIADVYKIPLDKVEANTRKAIRELRKRDLLLPTKAAQTTEDASKREGAEADQREMIRMEVPRTA